MLQQRRGRLPASDAFCDRAAHHTKQEELLRALPNIVEFEVPPGQQICIVGDIHGQYADLMHAFYMHGFPLLE